MKVRQPKRQAMAKSEAEIVSKLMDTARREGWSVYPETADFDVLLVSTPEIPIFKIAATRGPHHRMARETVERFELEPGFMIGVEAKRHANVKVLAQAISYGYQSRQRVGPDFRQVLIPRLPRKRSNGRRVEDKSFRQVAKALGVGVWTLRHLEDHRPFGLAPFYASRWEGKRPWVPPVEPTTEGGIPSPRALTKWRVAALRVCNFIDDEGTITRADFKRFGINPSTWIRQGWIVPVGKDGRRTVYAPPDPRPSSYPTRGFEEDAKKIRALDAC